MATFNCKMCGGALNIGDQTVVECEYCGTTQTLPKLTSDARANLYDRANHFRRNNEYDKAMGIYERILNEDITDAEAYWSLVLCRYGIEYVEDPTSHKRIPTINRAQFTSIFEDDNYKSALQYADMYQKTVYEQEAAAINEIQKGILAVSQKEEPFDVFICYKETDNNGRRTQDSVLANDLYHQLTQEGFKVFFARITLEDKLGSAYEPYIFAALNSAKVMVVLGTRPEFFNAVWVKNEWSRYLALIKTGAKKMLIPAYRDMDPYDLPEEFSHLQAQDMSKLGFMQDLIRGIKKIIGEDTPAPAATTAVIRETVVAPASSVAPLLKRVFMFLEDGDWNSANEYCEKVLDIDPENDQAYLGKLLSELRVRKQESLKDQAEPFDHSNNYQKAVRFADDKLKAALTGYIEHINTRNENARLDGIYTRAKNAMSKALTEGAFKEAAQLFESISEYQDSVSLAKECYEKAEVARKYTILLSGKDLMNRHEYEAAIELFESIPGWKDADIWLNRCQNRLETLKAQKEADRLERERQAEIARQEAERIAKRNKKIPIIATPIVCAIIAFIIILNTVIIPNYKYNEAIALMDEDMHREALNYFFQLDGYKDSDVHIQTLLNQFAIRETISAGHDHTVGLKADGSVVAVGDNSDGRCNVEDWTDIVAISAGNYHTVGLKADGTVVDVGEYWYLTGNWDDVEDWTEIVAISVGFNHIVGLKADGSVVAEGDNYEGQCYVKEWTDIVAISAASCHTVGLKADGTVVAVGLNDDGQCSVRNWRNIRCPQ